MYLRDIKSLNGMVRSLGRCMDRVKECMNERGTGGRADKQGGSVWMGRGGLVCG